MVAAIALSLENGTRQENGQLGKMYKNADARMNRIKDYNRFSVKDTVLNKCFWRELTCILKNLKKNMLKYRT